MAITARVPHVLRPPGSKPGYETDFTQLMRTDTCKAKVHLRPGLNGGRTRCGVKACGKLSKYTEPMQPGS